MMESRDKINKKLESIGVIVAVFLSRSFNEVYVALIQKIFTESEVSSPYNDGQSRIEFRNEWQAAWKLYSDLLDAARNSVGTEPLDEKSREAFGSFWPKNEAPPTKKIT